MDELEKMNRSIAKAYPKAPQEVWLVVDGSVGTNALAQAREFSKFSNINGVVCTKLDGTGKGGMVVAIKDEFDIPVLFVGLGEQPEDLQPFNPSMFADALFEDLER
jgi:fused signal recognition particle receptor